MIDIGQFANKTKKFRGISLARKDVESGKPDEIDSSKVDFDFKADSIDFSEANDIGKKSADEVVEYSGNWNVKIGPNQTLEIEIKNIQSGDDDEVSIPISGWTWHTHPKGCPNINDCSVIPPSANDFEIFAERGDDQHLVISKERIYWVKAKRKFSSYESKLIFKYYKKLETFFDGSSIDHDEFDDIFTLASKFGDFFTIYQFKNKKISHLKT